MDTVNSKLTPYSTLHHFQKDYFSSYWHQIDEIISKDPKNILEIGIAWGGFVSKYLKQRNFNVTTMDIHNNLHPDKIGSVTEIPFENNSFDLIACYEVLEHIEYNEVQSALQELYRVSQKYVILSIPNQIRYLKFLFSWSSSYSLRAVIPLKILTKLFPVKNYPEHHWEIGNKGISVKNLKNLFKNSKFKILKSYRVFEKPYHHFFVLQK